jgi:hypothetical protein
MTFRAGGISAATFWTIAVAPQQGMAALRSGHDPANREWATFYKYLQPFA